ncbi:MAG: ATP-binding cassette domain-containing protein [Phycisphaerales bacterium]|nr:ATP-binding cassette domain-containing protein [Phycisphaerales bacterium]
MMSAREDGFLRYFLRAAGYLHPHRRSLVLGLLAALGVSVFYTFSVSSIVPVLKIIFAEHESIVDWLHRAEAQRRLGVTLPPDVPDDPRGLTLLDVRPDSPNAEHLQAGERIVMIDGAGGSAYDFIALLAQQGGEAAVDVVVVNLDGQSRAASLRLRPHKFWWPAAASAASWLPSGRSAVDRSNTLLAVMAAVVLVSTIGAFCRFGNEGLVAIAVQRGMHDLRTELADHVLRLPLGWHSTQPPGDTLSRFAQDIGKVEVGINTLFGKVVREPLKAVGVLALTLLLDWHMLLIGMIGLPVGVVFIRIFGRMVKRAQRRASQSWGRLLDHLGERLAGIRVVKAFNMEGAESRRFAAEGRELTRAQTHIELVDAASSPALEMLASLAIAAFALYGGHRVFNQELEPHVFFGAIICLGAVFDPIRKMGNVYNRLQAADASGKRLFDILDLPAETEAGLTVAPTWARPEAAAGPLAPQLAFDEAIEFRDVCFSYPSDPSRRVLDRVNLRVERGQMIALVGPNGCGKTTLVSLLLRFFEPDSGTIRIDDRDIRTLPLAALRGAIGLVTQDAVVFTDTIRANISYGAGPVSDEQVAAAARLAHIEDFIERLRVEQNGTVSSGYGARVTARTLSGGQRQRIALARAVLRNPPILILDEATSQVDVESERKIQEALDDVARGRTTFVIAHRFSTIARADRIAVMNDGRLIATGRHDELVRTCPFYATLVQTQLLHGELAPAVESVPVS